MRFETMYNKLEDIAYRNYLPLSTVITKWDLSTNKLLKKYNKKSDSLNSSNHSEYDVCREKAIEIVSRYYRRFKQ